MARRLPLVMIVSFSPLLGGAERSMLSLAAHLPASGLRVLVLCPGGEVADAAEHAGVPVVRRAVRAAGPIRRDGRYSVLASVRWLAANAVALRHVVRACRHHRPDVVHSNSLPSHLTVGLAAWLTRRPASWHLREIVRPGVGRLVLEVAARSATCLVAISAAVAASVRHPRVSVVFNPVAGPEVAARRPSYELPAPVVGYIGRLEPHKGVAELVEAMRGNDAHLVVVGEGSARSAGYRRELERRSDEMAPGRVHLMGRVDDPWSALSGMDVLVVPSHEEPFGRVAVEGQLAGVAVLVADTGGLPQIVTDGHDGWLFRSGDVEHLSSQLSRLLADRSLRNRLAAAGRVSATRFAPRRHADSMADTFRELLAPDTTALRS